jgi:hypothetical protein
MEITYLRLGGAEGCKPSQRFTFLLCLLGPIWPNMIPEVSKTLIERIPILTNDSRDSVRTRKCQSAIIKPNEFFPGYVR